jgi:hypothetical protein
MRQWEKENAVLYHQKSHPHGKQLSCCHNGKEIYEKLTEITGTLLLLPC